MDNCNRHTDVAVELIKGAKSALFLYLTGGNLMNNKRRKELRRAIEIIETALDIVNSVKDEEEDAMYNYPENLQGTEAYENMEVAVDTMEEVTSAIEDGVDSLNNAASLLEEIV